MAGGGVDARGQIQDAGDQRLDNRTGDERIEACAMQHCGNHRGRSIT